MKKKSWKSTPNALYEITYHLTWLTKYRKGVIVQQIGAKLGAELKEILARSAKEHRQELFGIEVMDVGSSPHLPQLWEGQI